MAYEKTNIETCPPRAQSSDSNGVFSQRLDVLLGGIAVIDREKGFNDYKEEHLESSLIKDTLTTEEVYSQFGLMLGLFLPAAIFGKALWVNTTLTFNVLLIFLVMTIANFISAIIGYYSGKLIGRIVRELEEMPWIFMILILPFIGLFWALMAGGAGGIIFFGIGALFGAIIASVFSIPAVLIMTIFHRLIKQGDDIERGAFLSMAAIIIIVSVTFILS